MVYVLPPVRQGVRCLILMLFHGLKRLAGRLVNLLFVMKNDIGSLFLLLENCLRDPDSPLLHDEGLHVGSERYARVVLTPLMMDFGYKSRTPRGAEDAKKWIRYDIPGDRPIVEQVVDLFRGIRDYVGTESSPALAEKYPALGAKTRQVFEIYPFLGLNPANHTRERVGDLLEKYFGEYTGRWEDFRAPREFRRPHRAHGEPFLRRDRGLPAAGVRSVTRRELRRDGKGRAAPPPPCRGQREAEEQDPLRHGFRREPDVDGLLQRVPRPLLFHHCPHPRGEARLLLHQSKTVLVPAGGASSSDAVEQPASRADGCSLRIAPRGGGGHYLLPCSAVSKVRAGISGAFRGDLFLDSLREVGVDLSRREL